MISTMAAQRNGGKVRGLAASKCNVIHSGLHNFAHWAWRVLGRGHLGIEIHKLQLSSRGGSSKRLGTHACACT